MKLNARFRLFVLFAVIFLPSCANFRLLPKIELFPGLDETTLSQTNQEVISRAKADFAQVRRGKPPIHAKLVQTFPNSRTKIYRGSGYDVTFFVQDKTRPYSFGPDIVISPSVTGGAPYRYDEIITEPAIE